MYSFSSIFYHFLGVFCYIFAITLYPHFIVLCFSYYYGKKQKNCIITIILLFTSIFYYSCLQVTNLIHLFFLFLQNLPLSHHIFLYILYYHLYFSYEFDFTLHIQVSIIAAAKLTSVHFPLPVYFLNQVYVVIYRNEIIMKLFIFSAYII